MNISCIAEIGPFCGGSQADEFPLLEVGKIVFVVKEKLHRPQYEKYSNFNVHNSYKQSHSQLSLLTDK